MTNSRSLAVVAALMALGSCAPNHESLLLTGVFTPEFTDDDTTVCAVEALPDVLQGSGSLNLALGSSYLAVVGVDSLLLESELAPSSNHTILDEIRYTYTTAASPFGTPTAVPANETVSVVLGVKHATKGNPILFNMIGPAARQALEQVPVSTGGEYFTLKVGVRFRGKTVAESPVETNTLIYPINIHRSPASCATPGTRLKNVGPCGNTAQDGAPLICCTPDPLTGLCP